MTPIAKYTVGYIVGSLAQNSINRQLSRALIKLAPPELFFKEITIADLPLYNRDYDTNYPQEARQFKQELAEVDALLLITPEYNRSIPAALKNAIEWASRPYGKNSLALKPSAIIGASPGSIGTAVAQQHLRVLLNHVNSPQMNSPEAYIQFKPGLITEDGEVTVESTAEFLRHYMAEFYRFIDGVYTVLPRSMPRSVPKRIPASVPLSLSRVPSL